MSDSAIPSKPTGPTAPGPHQTPPQEADLSEIQSALKQATHIREDFEESDLDPSVSEGQNRGSTKQRMGINLHILDKAAEKAGIDNTSIQNLRFLGKRLENMDFNEALSEFNTHIEGLKRELNL